MKFYQRIGASLLALAALHCSPRYFVVHSDVNKDKHVDLIVGEQDGDIYALINSRANKEDTQRGNVSVYLDGERRDLPVREEGYRKSDIGSLLNGLQRMGVYDINNDGWEDVIAVDHKRNVYLFFNDGNGDFRLRQTIITP